VLRIIGGVGERRPLILGYHAVDSSWRSPLAISPGALAEQAEHLRRRGYVGLTASEAERRRLAGSLPERSVVFTFDDGYASTAQAATVLAEYGYPGTVFVVTNFADSGAPLSWFGVEHEDREQMQPMGWDELNALSGSGWEVGSHTTTHRLLTSAEEGALHRELADSRRRVIEQLGGCSALAYPYGMADARVAAAAAAAGYLVAYTLTMVETADQPLMRPRVGLSDNDCGVRLRVKLSRPMLTARRSGPARLLRRARRARAWIPAQVAGDGKA
jgi:peptidoglycan/xylan/chitin deacetylase (PgdA/CDA1 family)